MNTFKEDALDIKISLDGSFSHNCAKSISLIFPSNN